MRVIATLLVVLALGLSVYSLLEVRRLRAEVAVLRADAAAQSEQTSREARSRELLKSAEEHSKRAQELIRKGDAEGALREMQKSKDLLAESARATGGSDLVGQIREGAESTVRRLEDILSRSKKKVEAKPRPTKE